MSFPTSLTEEEIELKSMFEILKRVKKLAQTVKVVPSATSKNETDSVKAPKKRNLVEIAGATEEAKRLVKAGAMTISKVEEKQTFKRSKQLDRKLKEGDRDTSMKYQPFTPASFGNDYPPDEPPPASRHGRVPSLYDSFVSSGDSVGGNREPRVHRGTTIYVRGYDLMEEPLRKAFNDFGTIVRVRVEDRRKSAFIEYASNEEADRAIKEMNGNMLNGVTLRVTMARRQNYVFRNQGGAGSESPNSEYRGPPSAPESWSNLASGRGGVSSKEANNSRRDDGGRDLVSYDDADDY